ncbi:hypothetical protein AAHA92_33124 [Salvia divinorum]|uniref:Uncharacterized protein n=1 Tax=Salvia divinorum TaxID=28513 RepID=A0ABD1FMX8_SALDI
MFHPLIPVFSLYCLQIFISFPLHCIHLIITAVNLGWVKQSINPSINNVTDHECNTAPPIPPTLSASPTTPSSWFPTLATHSKTSCNTCSVPPPSSPCRATLNKPPPWPKTSRKPL